MRTKHRVFLGRWRIAWRFGRYRWGFDRANDHHWTGAVPFLWWSALRRNKGVTGRIK